MVTNVENVEVNEHLYVDVTETVCEIRTNPKLKTESKVESYKNFHASDVHSNGSGIKDEQVHSEAQTHVKRLPNYDANASMAPKGDNQSDFSSIKEKAGNDHLLKLLIDRNFDTTITLSEKGLKTIKNDCQEIVTGFEAISQSDVPLFRIERRHIKQDLSIGDTKQESLIERKEMVTLRLSGSKLKINPIKSGDIKSQSKVDESVSITHRDTFIEVMDKESTSKSSSKIINFPTDANDQQHSIYKKTENGELSGASLADQSVLHAEENVTITCSDAIIHVMERKRMPKIRNGDKSLDENKDIITGELLDKILLIENPNKEHNHKKSKTSNTNPTLVKGRELVFDDFRAPETLDSGINLAKKDQDSLVKSAIKKFESNSDIMPRGDGGLNQDETKKMISNLPKVDESVSGSPQVRQPGANSLSNFVDMHVTTPLTKETFSVETVEIIKEVMSP